MVEEELALQQKWYHNIEVRPGLITNGRINYSATGVRELLAGVDVGGRYCLDVGCMDAFYGLILERKGAERVICTDRTPRPRRIEYIKQMTGAEFSYVAGVSIKDLGAVLEKHWGQLADFTNFPGVVYHMFDPMGGLAMIRGLTKRGGLVLVDTPALRVELPTLLYNAAAAIYTESTYFIPSIRALQGMMLRVGLVPVDARWRTGKDARYKNLVRIAVMCRAWDPFPSHIVNNRDAALVDALNLREFVQPRSMFANDDPASVDLIEDDAAVEYLGSSGEPAAVDLVKFCRSESETPFRIEDNILRLGDRA
jgi:Protein of unknown function (DUF1698)